MYFQHGVRVIGMIPSMRVTEFEYCIHYYWHGNHKDNTLRQVKSHSQGYIFSDIYMHDMF